MKVFFLCLIVLVLAELSEAQNCELGVEIGADTTICLGDTIVLQYNPSTDTISWIWSNGSTDTSIIITEVGNYYIHVFSAFCSGGDTISVAGIPKPEIAIEATTVCFGEPTVFINNSVFLNGAEVVYNFGDGVIEENDNSVVLHDYLLNGNIYSVSIMINNGFGCVAEDSLFAEVNQNPSIVAFVQDVCLTNVSIFSLQTFDINPDAIVVFFPGDGNMPLTQPADQPAVEYTYELPDIYEQVLIVDNVNGCQDSVIISSEVFPPPDATFSGLDMIYCQNDPLDTLIAQIPGGTFEGFGITNLGGGLALYSPSQPGADVPIGYQVVDANGCIGQSEQIIQSIYQLPNLELVGLSERYCLLEAPDTIYSTFKGVDFFGPANVLTDNMMDDSMAVFNPFEEGLYILGYTYLDPNGCTSSVQQEVEVNELPIADLGNDTTLFPGASLTLSNSILENSYTYLWSTGATSTTITVQNPGFYLLQVTDQNTGCSASDTLFVDLELGLENKGNSLSIVALYPNPAADRITLEVLSKNSVEIPLRLLKEDGTVLSRTVIYLEPDEPFRIEFEVSNLPTGFYYMTIGQNTWPFLINR